MQDTSSGTEPRWGAWKTALLGWMSPTRAAWGSSQVPLYSAFGMHVLSLMAATIVFAIMAIVINAPVIHEISQFEAFVEAFAEVVEDIGQEIARHPLEFGLGFAFITGGTEFSFVLLALMLAAWGARDEPVLASIGQSLRRVWLFTSVGVVGMILAGLVLLPVGHASTRWWSQDWQSAFEAPPRPSTPVNPTAEEVQAYNEAMRAYHEAQMNTWEWRWNHRPWYVEYAASMMVGAIVIASWWALWILLQALAAPRLAGGPPSRPPMCEACGYNLVATPMEGRCPECGQFAWGSLGPEARPGSPWQQRDTLGFRAAWWATSVAAITRPKMLIRQMRLDDEDRSHRSFLLMHLPLFFLLAWFGLIVIYVVDTGDNPLDGDPEIVFAAGPALGASAMGSVLLTATAAAGLIGLIYRLFTRRNMGPAAMRIVCYLSGYLVLWTMFGIVWGSVAIGLEDLFDDLARNFRIHDALLVQLFLGAPTVVIGLAFLVLIWRGASGGLHANSTPARAFPVLGANEPAASLDNTPPAADNPVDVDS